MKGTIQFLKMIGKFSIYVYVISSFLFNAILAGETVGQKVLSVKEARISLEFNDLSIIDALKTIERNSNYNFVYKKNELKKSNEISITAQNETVESILLKISRQANLGFRQINERISVRTLSQASNRNRLEVYIEDISISGKITDEDGQPLPGATVLEKGSTNGTITDVDGNFSLNISDESASLLVSFVGYQSQELTVNGRANIDITLIPDVASLDEVVVVGYGTVKKRDLTGSVVSIKEKTIEDMPVTSIDQAIQGLAPGVVVQQQSGQPGGATSIRIRGGNSINAGNEPLYVIDGFPIYNENTSIASGSLGRIPPENALANINPNDIVSIEVLKDASATAIYGARAANGVIIITTRRGKEGVNNVDFEMFYGWQEAAQTYDLMDAYEYAMFRNDRYAANGLPVTYTDEQLEDFRVNGGTNWQEEMLRIAPVQNYQLSVSGGTEKVQYAVSGNYYDMEGTMINSYLDRLSLRSNIDIKPKSWMKFGESLTFGHTTSNQIPTGGGLNGRSGVQSASSVWAAALYMNPAVPVYDENGDYIFDNTYPVGENTGANNSNVPYGNPVAYANLVNNINVSNRLLGNVYGEFEFIEGLKLRITGGANIYQSKQNSYEPSTIRDGSRAPDGRAKIGTVQIVDFLNENTLTYDKQFQDHHLTLLTGFTQQNYQSESFNGEGVEFATDELGFNNIQGGNLSGNRPPSISSGSSEWSLMSGIFRAFYSFKDKYLLTLTSRYDGSSRLGANNKWAFFPSAAFGWRLSDEAFLSDQDVIDELKLRLSIGQSGNQNIPAFMSLSSLSISNALIGDNIITGFAPNRIGNPDLKWETTTQSNLGIDLGLFYGRLYITADAYYKKTTDLLFDVPIPTESGYSSAFKNIGSLENKGVELSLRASILTGALKWDISTNWGLNRNKVLELQGEEEILVDPRLNLLKSQNSLLLKVGEPIGNFYGYENLGIWQSSEEIAAANMISAWLPGQRRFADQNGDGLVNAEDRVVIGNALPSFTGGIINTFNYKDFDLSFLFDYSYGNDVANLTQLEFEFLNGRQSGNKEVTKRWQPDDITLPRDQWTNSTNPETDVQAVNGVLPRELHSRYVEDGSFIKLRNLTFGYSLPVQKWAPNVFRKVRIYFSGRNLLLFTKYTGLDPEATVFTNDNIRLGLDYAVYPTSRTYTFGINLGF